MLQSDPQSQLKPFVCRPNNAVAGMRVGHGRLAANNDRDPLGAERHTDHGLSHSDFRRLIRTPA